MGEQPHDHRQVPVEARDADELLRAARDELYVLRATTAPLRNRVKETVAVLDQSAKRVDALIDEIEDSLADPHARRRPRDERSTTNAQAVQ